MQTNRLFEIIYALLDRQSMTAKELAERLEVSARTIYRDVEILSGAGVPVYMSKGKGGGISLLPDFVLNKAILTDEEKLNILSALKAVSALHPTGTDTALQKLNAVFGGNNPDWIEVDFSSWTNANAEKLVFHQIKSAILERKAVSFVYANGKGEKSTRTVLPLKLGFKGQAWYLFGYCTEKQDNRFFKLTRIKELTVLDQSFSQKAPEQIFTEDNVFQEEYITLRLKLSQRMAFRVYDEFTSFEQMEDGSFIVETLYPKGEWLFGYVASFGEDCEVLAPEYAREHVTRKLEKTLGNYL